MTDGETAKYHISPQQAAALLGPIEDALGTFEERTGHYLAQLELDSAEDAAALRAARDALRQAVERVTAVVGQPVAGPASDKGAAATAGRKRVLITGAGGRIGRDLGERLKERYDLRLMYHHTVPEAPPSEDWLTAETTDMDAVSKAMAGVDAVVHLAGEPSPRASWEEVLDANIVGTRTILEAAHRAGVERVVFASTNHVMGMYDRDRAWPIYADLPVRPDSLYGVSKAFGETLGRFYADQHGLRVVCLRIGWFLDEPNDEISRWMWLSPRDCAQVVWRAIEADVRFGIYYAISANGGRHWDITDTIEVLGYRPEDDAERFFPPGG
ncbi:MAG TPA: NAD(P)-dependent oxidoreductase [Thermomicrobiales bacterium]|nr:NAD(P)-dependent oxidoreductase [Thermomicrobiales bacterium]